MSKNQQTNAFRNEIIKYLAKIRIDYQKTNSKLEKKTLSKRYDTLYKKYKYLINGNKFNAANDNYKKTMQMIIIKMSHQA